MFNVIRKKLRSNKGAMDTILVTLLLVVVGVAGIIGLSTWLGGQSTEIRTDAEITIDAEKNN